MGNKIGASQMQPTHGFWRGVVPLGAVILLWAIILSGAVVAQQTASEEDRLARDREIETTKNEIWRLYSDGNYADVIEKANYLLTLDPGNLQALFWKDQAGRRMQREPGAIGAQPEKTSPIPSVHDVTPKPRVTPEPTPYPTPTPVPQDETRGTTTTIGGTSLFSRNNILIILGTLAGLLIVVLLVVWLKARRSREEDEVAEQSVSGEEISDMPTAVYEAVTSEEYTAPTEIQDEPTLEEEPLTEEESADDTLIMTPQEQQEEVREVQEEVVSRREVPPSDVEATGGDTFGGVQTRQVEPERESDDKSLTFNSLMFGNAEETQAPQAPPPPDADQADQQEGQDDEKSLSFNSLMFGSAEETQAPKPQGIGDYSPGDQGRQGTPEPEEEVGESPRGAGDDDYQNLMFGAGTESTQPLETPMGDDEVTSMESAIDESIDLDGGLSLEPEGEDDISAEQTVRINTADLPGGTGQPAGGQGSPDEMFTRQKAAGLQALDEGDYAKAVQCLSVAASLKPDDRETGEKLKEARSLRNG